MHAGSVLLPMWKSVCTSSRRIWILFQLSNWSHNVPCSGNCKKIKHVADVVISCVVLINCNKSKLTSARVLRVRWKEMPQRRSMLFVKPPMHFMNKSGAMNNMYNSPVPSKSSITHHVLTVSRTAVLVGSVGNRNFTKKLPFCRVVLVSIVNSLMQWVHYLVEYVYSCVLPITATYRTWMAHGIPRFTNWTSTTVHTLSRLIDKFISSITPTRIINKRIPSLLPIQHHRWCQIQMNLLPHK